MQLILEVLTGLVRSVVRNGKPGIKAHILGDSINDFNTNEEEEGEGGGERENSFHLPFSRLGGNTCFPFHLLQSEYLRDFCVVVYEKL